VPIGRRRLVEAEHLIDHRLDRIASMARAIATNICIEPTEMPCTLARRPRMSAGLSSFAAPLKPADHTNLAADADGAERARQRRGAADLDHMVDTAAAGEVHGRLSQSGADL